MYSILNIYVWFQLSYELRMVVNKSKIQIYINEDVMFSVCCCFIFFKDFEVLVCVCGQVYL